MTTPRGPRDMSDRQIDRVIAGLLGRRCNADEELAFALLSAEWQRRHPGTLPPCYAARPFPPCYRGPRTIYAFGDEVQA